MVSAISGGPGPVAVAPAAKSEELNQGREQARQASVAQARAAVVSADPATIQRSAAYGVASNVNTQRADNHDDKRRLSKPARGDGDEPVRNEGEPGHKVNVEA